MAYISEFTMDVVHTPGTSNVVTDMLSCPPTTQNATNSKRHNSGTGGAASGIYAARKATNHSRHDSGSGAARARLYAAH